MRIRFMDGSTAEITLDNKQGSLNKQERWLNKDRIWTLVFWFGMSFGFSLANFLEYTLGVSEISSIIDWSTLLGIPLIVTLANRTRFIKKDTFANSEGRLIAEKQMPYSFLLAFILGLVVTFIAVKTLHLPRQQYGESHFFSSFIFFSFFFSGLSLYFIFKNCPISILFNRKFWTFELRPGGFRRDRFYESSSSSSSRSSSLNDYYTSPSYSSSMSNIYYDSHRR